MAFSEAGIPGLAADTGSGTFHGLLATDGRFSGRLGNPVVDEV